MSKLSVIIICKNEERVIEETLSCIQGWADEIIVLDSGSSDSTVEIAKKYTSQVFETDWPGYGIQKNRALGKASCDWVLTLDADERVSQELKSEISRTIQRQPAQDGYRIPVKLLYFGKYVKSLLKNKPLILFKRHKGKFNDLAVHESVLLDGNIGTLKKHLLHDSYESLPHQIQKLNRYATLWAQERPAINNGTIGLLIACLHSFWALFKDLLLKMALADGWRGVLLSLIHAQYTFNKYAFRIKNKLAG